MYFKMPEEHFYFDLFCYVPVIAYVSFVITKAYQNMIEIQQSDWLVTVF